MAVIFLALPGACATDQANFTGDVTPRAGTCDPASRAVLVKRGRYIQFVPHQGVLVLNGQAGPDGTLLATLETQGADRKPYHLAFKANLAGHDVTGEFVTPRCRYHVALHEAD